MKLQTLTEIIRDERNNWITPFVSEHHGIYFLSSSCDGRADVMAELRSFERLTGTFRVSEPMLAGSVTYWIELLVSRDLERINQLRLR